MHKLITAFFLMVLVCFSAPVMASNRCIDLMDAHATRLTLDLSYCDLHPDDLLSVEAYLERHPSIIFLSLRGNERVFSYTNSAVLAKNTSLLWLNASHTMQFVNADEVVSELVKMQKLRVLNLSNDHISNEAMPALVGDTHLIALNLSGNESINDYGLLMLATNNHIQSLDITGIPISNMSAIAFSKNTALVGIQLGGSDHQLDESGLIGLASNTRLTYLGINEESISPSIIQLLKNNKHLTTLALEGDHLTGKDADMLSQNKNIATLDLSENNIDDTGCKAIASMPNLVSLNLNHSLYENYYCVGALSRSKKLRSLFLDNNRLLGDGWKYFENNTTLLRLSINGDSTKNSDIYSIAKIKSLTELDASKAYIDSIDVFLLTVNPTITTLNFNQSYPLSEHAIQALADDSHLHTLNISFNGIENAGATILAKSTSLRVLDVSADFINDEGALAFGKFANLKTLIIYYNQFSDVGIKAMKANTNIATLVLAPIDDELKRHKK